MRISVLTDQYPALSETFVVNEIASLARIGHDVRVETAAWVEQPAEVPVALPTACVDDDPLRRRAFLLAWLVMRHPLGVLGDLASRRRWSREEPVRPLRVLAPAARRLVAHGTEHLHAHFAAGAALDALRLSRLLGVPYSVCAHAYDIYRSPANLPEKLREAAFATGECEYSVRDLRAAAGPPASGRVHVMPMGVDHERFRRSTPLPGGRHVVAVGRMVEKKGFRHLLQAVALLERRAPIERLTLVGDGPLRAQLEAQARELGLEHRVAFVGARTAAGVQATLEEADVVAVTAVPVADGDRDVLPLIVGEALAMEVPVVASDFVGLPEVVREPWGRLTPPGDAEAIADALEDVLGKAPEERAALGAAARAFVVRERDLEDAARRLAGLIAGR